MNMSPSIASLAKALSAAQAEMDPAFTGAQNPFFNSKYADLGDIWKAAKGPLTKNGLSVSQVTIPTQDTSIVVLETILMHSSGEWISGTITMKPAKQDPQGIGSCISYMRRYALAAIVGVVTEDDDGNAASAGQEQEKRQKKSKPAEKPAEKPAPTGKPSLITEAQRKRLFAIAHGSGWKNDELKVFLMTVFGIEHSDQIPRDIYEDLVSRVSEGPVIPEDMQYKGELDNAK